MFRRFAVLLMNVMLAVYCLLSAAAAETEAKTVRVGWYETPFNYTDSFGRRTGYAYEYQRKIAAYTGWKYQYVEGTWSELLQMLEEGRIDLMSDVSFMEERTEYMLFAGEPMGSELYYLYVHPDNRQISIDDPATLNGKKVGITARSVQKSLFLQWAKQRGITPEVIDLECTEQESLTRMKDGEIDAFITLETYGDPDTAVPLWKIGSSDFYFAVSKTRPDLLAELETALSRIQDENKLYSEQLSEKYLQDSGTNRYLTLEEKEWLDHHGKIKIGYQDKYLAFCAADPKTGALTGALKDYLELASGMLDNASPEFDPVVYPTASAAMDALRNGEIDCMFPSNLTDFDAESAGLIISQPLMRTEMDAVVRTEDKQDFLRKSQLRVGVNRGNPNYEMFLVEHFPEWTPVLYDDTPACLDAVSKRETDCIIISNYRHSDISRLCQRLNLTTVYTGVDMDYCLALREGSTILYSILSKMISQMPEATVNAVLNYYSVSSEDTGFAAVLQDHPVVVGLVALSITFLLIILILLFRLSAQKKSGKQPSRTEAPDK